MNWGKLARDGPLARPEAFAPIDRGKGLAVGLLALVVVPSAAGASFFGWLLSAVGVPLLVALTLLTSLAGLPAGIYYARRKELPALGRAAVATDITVNGLTALWYLLVLPWLHEMASTAWNNQGPIDAHVTLWLGFALVAFLLLLKLWLFRAGSRPRHLPAMKSQRAGRRWEIDPETKREWSRFAGAAVGWILLISLLRTAGGRHGWPELVAWLGVVFGGGFLVRVALRVRGHGLRLGLLWGLIAGSIAQEMHEFDRLGQMASSEILGIAFVLFFSVGWNGLLAYTVERYFWPRPAPDGHEASLGSAGK